ncbi:MAG: PDZ domain-containing protein [bacterium]
MIDRSFNSGAKVISVTPNGPAFNAGIKSGDVIFRVNSMIIKNHYHLKKAVSTLRPGTKATFHIIRNGSEIRVGVTLKSGIFGYIQPLSSVKVSLFQHYIHRKKNFGSSYISQKCYEPLPIQRAKNTYCYGTGRIPLCAV